MLEPLEDRLTPTSLQITPLDPTVSLGASLQFHAMETDDSGHTTDVTTTVSWTALPQSGQGDIVFSGSQGGLFTGLSAGTVLIQATDSQSVNRPLVAQDLVTVVNSNRLTFTTVPSSVKSGAGFTVEVAYQVNGATDSSFSGSVTLAINTGPTDGLLSGGPLTVSAVNGVAVFNGLNLDRAGTYTLQASADGVPPSVSAPIVVPFLLSIAVTPANPSIPQGTTEQFVATGFYSDQTTQNLTNQVTWASADTSVATISNAVGSQGLATGVGIGTSQISASLSDVTTDGTVAGSTVLTVTTPVVAPTIIAERVSLTYQHDKRGKPVGEPLVSFVFSFSTAMDPGTAGNSANYQVEWASTKRVAKHTVIVLHPIAATATYDALSHTVTLTTTARQVQFARGGAITIFVAPPTGVSSEAGVFLAGPTRFTISPRATGIVPSV
jgi:hypothetical protein